MRVLFIVCFDCLFILFISPHQERETQLHKRSTVWKRWNKLCELKGQHRAVPLTCSQNVCVYVCLSVCPRAYLWNHCFKLYQTVCACYLWLHLYLPLVGLQLIMYFRFYGWRHVFLQWAQWRHVDTAAATPLQRCVQAVCWRRRTPLVDE